MLHVDKNEYYGGTEAALSLQEIETWIEKVNDGKIIGVDFADIPDSRKQRGLPSSEMRPSIDQSKLQTPPLVWLFRGLIVSRYRHN